MNYYVFKNPDQDRQIENLLEISSKVNKNNTDLEDLIKTLVTEIRDNNEDLSKNLYLHPILQSINHIAHSYKRFCEARDVTPNINEKGEIEDSLLYEAYEEEEEMLLIFFVNARIFLDLVKKFTRVAVEGNLYRDISTLRHYFVHSHEKEIEQRKFFVIPTRQRGLREHSLLRVYDIDSQELSYEIHFSLDVFYFLICDIFRNLKENPSLFNQHIAK